MKNMNMYPDSRTGMSLKKIMPRPNDSSQCDVHDVEAINDEIVLKKRISMTMLIAFLPFVTALYLIASNFDVNKTYFIAFAFIYAAYYLVYSIWACSSHCPTCGKYMTKKHFAVIPSLVCSHCGHDLEHTAKH